MLPLVLLACREPAPATGHPEPVFDGVPREDAVVWDGFEQAWGYNHRINSLGDYVGPLACDDGGCTVERVHSAASGSGRDTAIWTSRHTFVRAPGVSFVQGATHFDLVADGEEGGTLERTELEPFPVDGEVQTVVLAGWDLWAVDDADRVRDFAVAVGDVEDGAFEVAFTLGTDCDSLECDGVAKKLDRSVAYEGVVTWLAIAADADTVAEDAVVLTEDYAWAAGGLPDEIALSDLAQDASLPSRAPAGGASALAFRSISVSLDRDHHMAEWATELVPGAGDDFELTLGFKQWNAGTYWNPLSYIEPGAADLAAEIVRLDFATGCAQAGGTTGALVWAADGRPSDADAVHVEKDDFVCE